MSDLGSVRKKTHLEPLPENAEVFTRKGERLARWKDATGRKRTARVSTADDGTESVVVESGRWLAKYRTGTGALREVSTGCYDKQAALAELARLERRAELVKSGIVSSTEDAISDHQATALVAHFADYLVNMQSRNLSKSHISEVTRYLHSLADECNFTRLADVTRSRFDRWMVRRREEDTGARTLNCFRAAWIGFLNWCVDDSRLTANPLAGVPQADEKADRRRQRRSMTETELQRFLYVARWRPLAEYGRERVFKTPAKGKRTSWSNTPLTFETIDFAVGRARERLSGNASLVAELEHRGKERQLIYKTMLTTGLRKKELSSVRLRNIDLESDPACLTLDAGNEKNREGNSIPLRADLAADLREWLADRLASRQAAVCEPLTLSFEKEAARLQDSVTDNANVSGLSMDELLFNVPSSILRVLDRDLKAAGIPKRDDRGRTLDVHALRHTFGTHLRKAGVPLRTAQAAMRHSSPTLTANIYTDPRLLDVHGAVEALPVFSVGGPAREHDRDTSTGTDERAISIHPPQRPPATVPNRHSVSSAGNLGDVCGFNSESPDQPGNSAKPTKKARILIQKDSGLESGRHDLNMRLPAPKPLPIRYRRTVESVMRQDFSHVKR